MTYFEISVYMVSLGLFSIALFLAIMNIPLIWRNREPRILGNLFFARNIALIISTSAIIMLKLSMLHAYVYSSFSPLSSPILLVVEYTLSLVVLTDCAISRAFLSCDQLSLRRLSVWRENK